MSRGRFSLGYAPTRAEYLMPPSPRTLLPAGWVTLCEAIAWVGFGQAVPVQLWDLELALGLSLWPWSLPHDVKDHLHSLAETAVVGTSDYVDEEVPVHRTWLVGPLRELARRRMSDHVDPASPNDLDPWLRAEPLAAETHGARLS